MTDSNAEEALQLLSDLFHDARVFLAMDVLRKLENFLETDFDHALNRNMKSSPTLDLINSLKLKNERLEKTLHDTESVSMRMRN